MTKHDVPFLVAGKQIVSLHNFPDISKEWPKFLFFQHPTVLKAQ